MYGASAMPMTPPILEAAYTSKSSIRAVNTSIVMLTQVCNWSANIHSPSSMFLLGIGRLDYVVSAAEAKGVKLVLPLLNNYNDLGGINVYNAAFGSTHPLFYTDAKSQAACESTTSPLLSL